ncbi:N-acetylmuramoyl-L-alanine amidase [Arthrobacter sp. ok362]|uniref:peptidoglycan recognition protein family protein n=1 Tax=Arthrobacter sp. ok362 TaxID=1761745 RepID=UPI0008883727|nr:N-acetylmuramoyl-L-alanine amidase [Arthrobacter sp. ok362]SDK78815.1 N-acetylmuramoyl-L-alanine amidase [Arthrobacter sp. ok362]
MKLSNLANVLRAAGLTVVETPGWATRGYAGQDLTEIRGVLWHHTATASARGMSAGAPTLQMTLNGRSDLAGPLCNITFGRDGTVYLVAAGVANHAGRGSAPGFPRDTGNHYLIGIEMESSGVLPWDWTLDQIRVAPHLGAAIERAYLQGLPEDMRLQLGHKEYSSEGKIDPAGWPGDMDGLRASINAVLNGSAAIAPQSTTTKPQEDTLSAAEVNQIIEAVQAEGEKTRDYVAKLLVSEYSIGGQKFPGGNRVSIENQRRITEAREIVKQIAAKTGVEIDYDKIAESVKHALADGITVEGTLTASNGGK